MTKVRKAAGDRKSTRLNSSHRCISYAVFCLKKHTAQTDLADQETIRKFVVLDDGITYVAGGAGTAQVGPERVEVLRVTGIDASRLAENGDLNIDQLDDVVGSNSYVWIGRDFAIKADTGKNH